MELSFPNIIIVELADFTKIFSHSDATIGTNMRNRLLCVTNRTNNLLNFLSDQLMTIINIAQHARGFVMTMTAIIDLIAAGGSNFTSSPIMLAPIAHLPKIKAITREAFHSFPFFGLSSKILNLILPKGRAGSTGNGKAKEVRKMRCDQMPSRLKVILCQVASDPIKK